MKDVMPEFIHPSCGQKWVYEPITRALVWELNVRATVIG
jgi:hypothetical protein